MAGRRKRASQSRASRAVKYVLTALAAVMAAFFSFFFVGGFVQGNSTAESKPAAVTEQAVPETADGSLAWDGIPAYAGKPYVVLNGNRPRFSREIQSRKNAYYSFTPRDSLGRCGRAVGRLGPELLPKEQRKPIGMIKPSGWQYTKYSFVDGKYLYNRCHLIAFQLCGENANRLNLITGTRYSNVTGMLPFENRVADFIRNTHKHVLYSVTPVYRGDDLVARGVAMEAWSVEDGGKGVHFNVFVYNVQPGVVINYADGTSRAAR